MCNYKKNQTLYEYNETYYVIQNNAKEVDSCVPSMKISVRLQHCW